MTGTARKSIFLIVAAFCLATSACVVTSVSPREAFLRANSSERKKYVSLWEVSPESLREASGKKYYLSEVLIGSLRRDFSNHDDLKERLEKLDARLKKSSRFDLETLEKMLKQATFDAKKDTLFSYDYRDDWRHSESGWLVVRDNRIRFKQVLSTIETGSPK